MKRMPTFRDFKEATPHDLMKSYGINTRQLEMAQRKVCDGASVNDLRNEYNSFYIENVKESK